MFLLATRAVRRSPCFPLGIPRWQTGKDRNFWTSAIESQKAAEDSQNEGNVNDYRWFIVL